MIGRLTGVLTRRRMPQIVIDTGGIGFELSVSLGTFEGLPSEGATVSIEVLTVFRSESLQLVGFGTSEEKHLFSLLLGVTGIGPKLALALLSTMSPSELVRVVREERLSALEKVPGIGRKSAQRLVLELKDRLKRWDGPAAAHEHRPAGAPELTADAIAALESLGYRRAEAEAAVGKVATAEGADLSALVRSALRALGSR